MDVIDAALKEFVESPVAVLVGTGDADGRPEGAYGWGPCVHADGKTVDVYLDTERAGRTLDNLRINAKIAVTLADPISLRSVQFKGKFESVGAPDEQERARVQRWREAFVTVTSLIGDPPKVIRNLWLDEITRVRFTVERAFNQTPGPEAGKPL